MNWTAVGHLRREAGPVWHWAEPSESQLAGRRLWNIFVRRLRWKHSDCFSLLIKWIIVTNLQSVSPPVATNDLSGIQPRAVSSVTVPSCCLTYTQAKTNSLLLLKRTISPQSDGWPAIHQPQTNSISHPSHSCTTPRIYGKLINNGEQVVEAHGMGRTNIQIKETRLIRHALHTTKTSVHHHLGEHSQEAKKYLKLKEAGRGSPWVTLLPPNNLQGASIT